MVPQKTRVMFLSSPERPGADTFIHMMLMRCLCRSRFEVHVACPGGRRGVESPVLNAFGSIPDVHIRPSNFGPSLAGRSKLEKGALVLGSGPPLLGDFLALARYIRRHRISVLHSTDRPRDALSCVLLGKITGAKSVVHVHVKYSDWVKRSVSWALAHADALVGVSRFVARSLVNGGFRAETTHVVLNAIDAADWDHLLDPGPVRRELNLSSNVPVVVCVARLFHWKGQGDLIRAMSRVRRDFPDVHLLIVGAEDRLAGGNSYSSELRALARSLDLERHVTLTGERSDIPALLAAADVFALPSFEEPFGLVFLEAFAMKKPVVALDSGGVPEVVEHQKSGLLSSPGDLEALASNLLALLRNAEMRKRMGEYSRRQVETRFTPLRMTRDAEAVYAKLVAPDAAGA
jgi:glycosyltransferase involved in cell wall biosynthesis